MRKKPTLSFVVALAFIFTVLISIVGYRVYKNYETARQESEAQKLNDALTRVVKNVEAGVKADNEKLSPLALEAKRAEAIKKADLAITNSRAEAQRFLNDIAVMFPAGMSAMCYQSAISNYIEDQWNEIAKQNGCTADLSACKNHEIPNSSGLSPMTDQETQKELDNTWFIASGLYNYLRSLDPYLAGGHSIADQAVTNISPEELRARADNLNKYITGCGGLRPVAWSVVGTPFANTYPSQITIDAIKLGAYKLLAEKVAARTLPDDNKTYVSCLSTYVQMTGKTHKNGNDINERCGDDKRCIETIPVDTKEYLFQTLDDLKTHNCLSSYLYEKEHR